MYSVCLSVVCVVNKSVCCMFVSVLRSLMGVYIAAILFLGSCFAFLLCVSKLFKCFAYNIVASLGCVDCLCAGLLRGICTVSAFICVCVQGLYSRTLVAMLVSLHKVCCYIYNVHVCIQLCSFSFCTCMCLVCW